MIDWNTREFSVLLRLEVDMPEFGSSRFRSTLDVTATFAMIIAALALVASSNGTSWRQFKRADPSPLPTEPIPIGRDRVHGSPDAKVALLQFTDFECPFCAVFARETLPTLLDKYVRSGRLLLSVRHLPLKRIHPLALRAALTAECAGRQRMFWPMHDKLFQTEPLTEELLRSYTISLGLDSSLMDTCVNGSRLEIIKGDAILASKLRISSTPTFFLGRVQADGRLVAQLELKGAKPVSVFENALEDIFRGKLVGVAGQ